ncbi:MAG: histidine kinase [Firmicutes bacterium]|nr:histidine kinase [Bacillota bacterium]
MAVRGLMLNLKGIDLIFEQTVLALRNSQEQIFDIAEMARSEYESLQKQARELSTMTTACIQQVDGLEIELDHAKRRLAEVDRNFLRYDETEIKRAYDAAQSVQVKLAVAREREMSLRRQRDELDRSIRKLGDVVTKAETMVKQVGVAMQVLAGDLESAFTHIENLQEKSILATRIIQAQEDERRRLARDIHDGPAQTLASLVLKTEICERLLQEDRKELSEEIAELKDIVQYALVDTRRIIFNLRPMVLDDLGLAPTLRRYMTSVQEDTDARVQLVILGKERRLPETVEITVFRLVQEAVNNALQHAEASQISVRLEFADDQINMQVEDNGRGFDAAKARSQAQHVESFGLLFMGERVDLLEGTLRIDSNPGRGTIIFASVPLNSE